MKISKRILGVALAIIMIFNVFAVGTFAAFPDDTAVQLNISTDKATYAPGDEVVLTFNVKVIEEIGGILQGGQYEIAYDSAVLEPWSTSTVLADHGYTELIGGTSGYSLVQFDSACEGNGSWLDDGIASAYGVDTRINYTIVDDPTNTCSAEAVDGADVFSVKMKIKDDAVAGTYTISYNPGGYEGYNAYVNDNLDLGGLYGVDANEYGFSVPNMYEYGTCTFTVATAAADPEVTHAKTMGQMADWTDTTATTFNAGFVGKISNLDVEFDANDDECTTIESIVVEITRGDVTLTGNAYQLYAQADGSYLFRAVVKNAAISDTEAISYKYIVTLADGSELTYESTEDTSFNAIYNTAKANYDAANA